MSQSPCRIPRRRRVSPTTPRAPPPRVRPRESESESGLVWAVEARPVAPEYKVGKLVCMYVYIYIYIYICVYVYVCVCMYVCVCVCVCCVYVYICVSFLSLTELHVGKRTGIPATLTR